MNVLPSFRTALRSRVSYVSRTWYSTTPPAANTETASNPTASSSATSTASSSSSGPSTSAHQSSRRLDEVQANISAAASKPARGRPTATSTRPAFNGSTAFPTSSPSPRSAARAPPSTAEDNWRHASVIAYSSPVTTTTARSFEVKNNDVAKAYRLLNRVLMENNVRKELRRQERFESGSDKRVRLNSERHRRRFKVAVGKAVSLAMRMKDM